MTFSGVMNMSEQSEAFDEPTSLAFWEKVGDAPLLKPLKLAIDPFGTPNDWVGISRAKLARTDTGG